MEKLRKSTNNKIFQVSCSEHRTNQSIVEELVVKREKLLTFFEKVKIMLFQTCKTHQTLREINIRRKSGMQKKDRKMKCAEDLLYFTLLYFTLL